MFIVVVILAVLLACCVLLIIGALIHQDHLDARIDTLTAESDAWRMRTQTAESHLCHANALLEKRQGQINRIRDELKADEA